MAAWVIEAEERERVLGRDSLGLLPPPRCQANTTRGGSRSRFLAGFEKKLLGRSPWSVCIERKRER
jgi:hypothetical protein